MLIELLIFFGMGSYRNGAQAPHFLFQELEGVPYSHAAALPFRLQNPFTVNTATEINLAYLATSTPQTQVHMVAVLLAKLFCGFRQSRLFGFYC